MVAYNNLMGNGELRKEYFNMSCPNVSSCPEGTNCTKSPVNCSRAREMSLSQPDSKEYGLGLEGLELGGLESSLKDYFSSDDSYHEAGMNYSEMVDGAGYNGNSLVSGAGDYASPLTNQNKYDTSTYQTVA